MLKDTNTLIGTALVYYEEEVDAGKSAIILGRNIGVRATQPKQ